MDQLPINPTDLVVIGVLLLSALLAMMRGFVAEVLSIAAWLGALAVAIYQYPLLQPHVTRWTGITGDLAAFGAGAVLFVIAVILFSIAARFLCQPLAQITRGAVDRTLGVLFGLLRGAVLVSFGYALLAWVLPDPDERPAWLQEARTLPYLAAGARELERLIPAHMRSEADLQLERLQRQADELDRRRMIEGLTSPSVADPATDPAKDDASSDGNGYSDGQRQELNRAIQGTQ